MVAAITPMFSAYVVVGDPPTALVSTVATPSAVTARPTYGSRSVPVISPTAFTCPMFSAINAITAGRTSSTAEVLKSGAWKLGSPNQGAEDTASKLTRSCGKAVATQYVPSAGQAAPAASRRLAPGSTDVTGPAVMSSSHDRTNPATSPISTPTRPMNPLNATITTNVMTIVTSAIQWSCGQ